MAVTWKVEVYARPFGATSSTFTTYLVEAEEAIVAGNAAMARAAEGSDHCRLVSVKPDPRFDGVVRV